MKKVLVTGGFGYVGSRLTELLLEREHDVCVLDLMLYSDAGLEALNEHPRQSEFSKRFRLVRGDLRDASAVRDALKDRDAVIHLAAISNDPTGNVDEVLTRQVNFDAVGQLLILAKEAKIERFINASSSSVFGIKHEENVTEDLEPEPLTYYSRYKALSEWLVMAAKAPDFHVVNIRPATICGYSPRQRFDLTVNKLTCDALTKKVITVHGGEQRRPNVGMNDIIEIYARLLEADPRKFSGKTFNFGFENHRVIEIARIIQKELADLDVSIEVTETEDKRDYHISSERILREFDYAPVSSIRREIAELRKAIEGAKFTNVDADEYYNMKSMKLGRRTGCYGLSPC